MSQSSVPTAATVPVRDDSLRAGQPPSGVGGGGTLLGHPKGLFLLFLVEMWERFSYYGMRGLLVLYLIAVFSVKELSPGVYTNEIEMTQLKQVDGKDVDGASRKQKLTVAVDQAAPTG